MCRINLTLKINVTLLKNKLIQNNKSKKHNKSSDKSFNIYWFCENIAAIKRCICFDQNKHFHQLLNRNSSSIRFELSFQQQYLYPSKPDSSKITNTRNMMEKLAIFGCLLLMLAHNSRIVITKYQVKTLPTGSFQRILDNGLSARDFRRFAEADQNLDAHPNFDANQNLNVNQNLKASQNLNANQNLKANQPLNLKVTRTIRLIRKVKNLGSQNPRMIQIRKSKKGLRLTGLRLRLRFSMSPLSMPRLRRTIRRVRLSFKTGQNVNVKKIKITGIRVKRENMNKQVRISVLKRIKR